MLDKYGIVLELRKREFFIAKAMSNKEYAAELRKPAIETVRKPLALSTEAAAAFHAAILHQIKWC